MEKRGKDEGEEEDDDDVPSTQPFFVEDLPPSASKPKSIRKKVNYVFMFFKLKRNERFSLKVFCRSHECLTCRYVNTTSFKRMFPEITKELKMLRKIRKRRPDLMRTLLQ